MIGMGHILRSQVLAKILYARNIRVFGVTIGDKDAVLYTEKLVKDEEFKWRIQVVQDHNAAIENLISVSPDLVVLDCAITSQYIVLACKRHGISVLALDYFAYKHALPDAIINLIDHNTDKHCRDRLVIKGLAYYEGSQYSIIRDEFNSTRELRISREEPVLPRKIVIIFGGADPSGNTKRALSIIAQWPSPFLVDLIIGPLFTFDFESTISAIKNCNITIHKSPTYIAKVFELADLVFCGGGGTLLEALYVGIPAIVIAQNEAEHRHANSFAEGKACWMLEDISWEIISSKVNRIERSKHSRDYVDGLGAKRICEIIEQQLERV